MEYNEIVEKLAGEILTEAFSEEKVAEEVNEEFDPVADKLAEILEGTEKVAEEDKKPSYIKNLAQGEKTRRNNLPESFDRQKDVSKRILKGFGAGAGVGAGAGAVAGAVAGGKGRRGKAALSGAGIGAMAGLSIGAEAAAIKQQSRDIKAGKEAYPDDKKAQGKLKYFHPGIVDTYVKRKAYDETHKKASIFDMFSEKLAEENGNGVDPTIKPDHVVGCDIDPATGLNPEKKTKVTEDKVAKIASLFGEDAANAYAEKMAGEDQLDNIQEEINNILNVKTAAEESYAKAELVKEACIKVLQDIGYTDDQEQNNKIAEEVGVDEFNATVDKVSEYLEESEAMKTAAIQVYAEAQEAEMEIIAFLDENGLFEEDTEE